MVLLSFVVVPATDSFVVVACSQTRSSSSSCSFVNALLCRRRCRPLLLLDPRYNRIILLFSCSDTHCCRIGLVPTLVATVLVFFFNARDTLDGPFLWQLASTPLTPIASLFGSSFLHSSACADPFIKPHVGLALETVMVFHRRTFMLRSASASSRSILPWASTHVDRHPSWFSVTQHHVICVSTSLSILRRGQFLINVG